MNREPRLRKRERKRERKTVLDRERQTERETDRQTDRETDRDRQRERERERERYRQTGPRALLSRRHREAEGRSAAALLPAQLRMRLSGVQALLTPKSLLILKLRTLLVSEIVGIRLVS